MFEDSENYYLITELSESGDLDKRIKKDGPLLEIEASYIIR